jgi:hypothetical protein
MSWFLGCVISGVIWVFLNTFWPPPGLREIDEGDAFNAQLNEDEEKNQALQITPGIENTEIVIS